MKPLTSVLPCHLVSSCLVQVTLDEISYSVFMLVLEHLYTDTVQVGMRFPVLCRALAVDCHSDGPITARSVALPTLLPVLVLRFRRSWHSSSSPLPTSWASSS